MSELPGMALGIICFFETSAGFGPRGQPRACCRSGCGPVTHFKVGFRLMLYESNDADLIMSFDSQLSLGQLSLGVTCAHRRTFSLTPK